MEVNTVWHIICIIIGLAAGYFIGKQWIKPKGEIVYELYWDEEEQRDACRCTFRMDLDVDEIIKENYILLEVKADDKIKNFYRQNGVSI